MNKRPIKPEVLLEYRWISDPTVHPATSEVAYVMKEADEESNSYRTHIRRVCIDGTKEGPLTDGANDGSPSWSPDGTQLAFLRTVNQRRQLFTIAEDGTEPKQMTFAKRGVGSFVWSPNGDAIVYTSKVCPDKELEALSPEQLSALKGLRGNSYNRTIPKAEGSGWWDGLYSHLFRLTLLDGQTMQLTAGDYNASQPAWSPDGKQVAFLAKIADMNNAATDLDRVPFNDIYTVSLSDLKVEKRTVGTLNILRFRYSPDGANFAIIGDDRTFGSGTQNRLYTVSATGGIPVSLHSETEVQIGNFILNDVKTGESWAGPLHAGDDSDLYAIGTFHGQAHIYRFHADAEPEAITAGNYDFHQLTASSDGEYLIAFAMNGVGPAEMYRIHIGSGEIAALTSWNKALMEGLACAETESIWTETEDGFRVEGWLLKPPGLTEGQKAPLVLVIHGGPHAMYAATYSHELQTLAAEGYAVLFANPRGSFGYGQYYARACRGDFGGGDYRDLMHITDAAIARFPFIDDKRLGVMGGSYGGLMTNWIVGQNDRFQAAVSQRCISNWLSFYGTSDIGISYTEGIVGGNPWKEPELLWAKSPLAHADKVKAPMLIMHGEQDFRCPIGQSDEWYTALKRLGNKARLVRYPGGNHSFLKTAKPSFRIDALREVNAWLEEHLAGGASS